MSGVVDVVGSVETMPLRRTDLHGSATDPVMDTMNFLVSSPCYVGSFRRDRATAADLTWIALVRW